MADRTGAEQGRLMLAIARHAIETVLDGGPWASEPPDLVAEPWMTEPGACFVTLTRHGRLMGCIGSLAPRLPLLRDLADNACSAAFRDPRFRPMDKERWPGVAIEVSVLGPMEEVPGPFPDEASLLGRLEHGVHGLVIEWEGHRATFLPQVWAQLPDPVEFLGRLKEKAGLGTAFWAAGIKAWRYGVREWSEDET